MLSINIFGLTIAITFTACDNCTQILLNDLDDLIEELERGTNHTSQRIPPPWPMLFEFVNRTQSLREQLDQLNRASESLNINDDEYRNLEKQIKDSLDLARQNLTNIEKLSTDSENLKDDALLFWEHDLEPAIKDMNDIIQQLKNFVMTASTIDTDAALMNATETLNQIKAISLSDIEEEAKKKLENCEILLDYINMMLPSWSAEKLDWVNLNNSLDAVDRKIADSRRQMFNITNTEKHVRDKIDFLTNALSSFNEKVEDIMEKAGDLSVLPFYLNITFDEYETRLENWDNDWSNYKDDLKQKEELLRRLGPEYDEIYVKPSMEHALKLKEDAERFKA